MKTNLKTKLNQLRKTSPLLLIIVILVSAVGVGALARYLFSVPVVIDLTTVDNPYEVALIRNSLPVTQVDFEGRMYEDDLVETTVETLSYYLDTLNAHEVIVYAYVDVEGLMEGTINVMARNGDWIIVDVLTPEVMIGTYCFEFPVGTSRLEVKFSYTSLDPSTQNLVFNIFGEDSLRAPP